MSRTVYYLSGPKRNLVPGYWLYDNLKADGFKIKTYYTRIDDNEKPSTLKIYFRIICSIFNVLTTCCKNDLILVYDSDSTGVLLGFFVYFLRPDLLVHKINCMASSKERLFSNKAQWIARIAYKKIYTSCNNENIAKLFSDSLNVPLNHFIPIPDSISDYGDELLSITDIKDDGYIFMGGASHRDYDLFIEVAKSLPQLRFMAVTFEKYRNCFLDAPRNVEVIYGLPERDFYKCIAHASIIYIPLKSDVQGGQMVLFQGALLKKPLITTENVAIHTYFDSSAISIVPIGGRIESIDCIKRLINNPDEGKKMGESAYAQIIKFSTSEIYKMYKKKLFCI